MSIVVPDTGPLHYLVLIEAIQLLPRLYGAVLCRKLFAPNSGTRRRPHWSAPG